MKLNLKAFFPVAAIMLFVLSITGYAHGNCNENTGIRATSHSAHSHEVIHISEATAKSTKTFLEANALGFAFVAILEEEDEDGTTEESGAVRCAHKRNGSWTVCSTDWGTGTAHNTICGGPINCYCIWIGTGCYAVPILP